MQSDPDLSQFRHSLLLQVGVVQGEAHEAILTHAPIPLAAAAGAVDPAGVDSQPDEVAPPRPRSVASASLRPPGSLSAGSLRCASSPLFPMIEPYPPSYPCIEFPHLGIRVADAEVVHPARGIAPQFVDHKPDILPTVAFGDLIRCTHPSGSLAAVYLRRAPVPSRAV